MQALTTPYNKEGELVEATIGFDAHIRFLGF
jgi:hypothetical protein